MSDQADRSILEQHMQTLISVVVAALIGWAGLTLQTMQQDVATLTTKIETLQSEVSRLRQLDQDRYSNTQAAQDWARNRLELDDIRKRLRDLEISR